MYVLGAKPSPEPMMIQPYQLHRPDYLGQLEIAWAQQDFQSQIAWREI